MYDASFGKRGEDLVFILNQTLYRIKYKKICPNQYLLFVLLCKCTSVCKITNMFLLTINFSCNLHIKKTYLYVSPFLTITLQKFFTSTIEYSYTCLFKCINDNIASTLRYHHLLFIKGSWAFINIHNSISPPFSLLVVKSFFQFHQIFKM